MDKLNFKNIDMLVIDGPPETACINARYPVIPFLHEYFNDKYVVFLDDAERDDEKNILSMWLSEHKEMRVEIRKYEKGCIVITPQS